MSKLLTMIGGKSTVWGIGITGAIAAVIIGALCLRIHWLQDDLDTKNKAYNTLTGDYAVSEGNVVRLTGALDRQNRAVEALRADKAALDAKVREEALKAAEKRKSGVSVTEPGVTGMNNFFKGLFQ